MKYFVFAFDHYYPAGGMSDLYGQYDTLDAAVAAAKKARELYDEVEVWTLTGTLTQQVEVS